MHRGLRLSLFVLIACDHTHHVARPSVSDDQNALVALQLEIVHAADRADPGRWSASSETLLR